MALITSFEFESVLAWSVGWPEIALIVLLVLLLFGGRKLPELARGLGKGMREFKQAIRGVKDDVEAAGDEPPENKEESAAKDENNEGEAKG